MNEEQAELIAEQLSHALDLLRSDLKLANLRLKTLEDQSRDHELRLRSISESVSQFKVWSGLGHAGQSFLTFAAFLRTWLGG